MKTVHPEMKEQFEAELRDNMVWFKKATPEQIHQRQILQARNEQTVLLKYNRKRYDLAADMVMACDCMSRNKGLCHDWDCSKPTKVVFTVQDVVPPEKTYRGWI